MKKLIVLIPIIAFVNKSFSQELYVFTEPASNMPAKTLSFKLTGFFPIAKTFMQRYKPEVLTGISKKWMVHFGITVSDYYSQNLRFESGRLYTKYRFYSNDQVHKHFRMAAFGNVSLTKSPYVFGEANLEGDNSGFQSGFIATQLLNKVALSTTISYTQLFNVNADKLFIQDPSYHFIDYSLSVGYLLFPKEYKNYNQTNLNIYLEALGASSIDHNNHYIDLAPAIQFIFNSNTKINIGYRFQVQGNMSRLATLSLQVAVEHTLFNMWK